MAATEPIPPATENKTNPNNLTREADGDSGANKENQAEANPNPSGNLDNVPEIVITVPDVIPVFCTTKFGLIV